MSVLSYAQILARVEPIAAQAASLVMRGYRRGTAINKKGAIDLVTEFDLASEALLTRELSSAFPGYAVVGEEANSGRGRVGAPAGRAFFVDPIDGTTNFAHGHPFFCVSVGLCEDGVPVLGVVVAPALGVTWLGAAGLGMRRNGEPTAVSGRAALLDAVCATGFGYDVVGNADDNIREFDGVQRAARAVRRCGAAALDLCLVSDGTYDAYWEYMLQPWDAAAGAALVRAAGGHVTAVDGGAYDLCSGAVLASNGLVHGELSALLMDLRCGSPVRHR
ncbi:MAG: Inositol-phosphate phosphatase [Pseudomonadota bacterium]|jgi:myo-inositol-1(or 4)-monophosphatase